MALANVAVNGAIAVTGSTITLNGTTYTSTTDAITLTGAVELGAGAVTTTLTSGAGAGDNITVTGAINDAGTATSLTLNAGAAGNVDLQGTVGNTGRPADLTVSNSAITDLNNVQTVGAIAVTAGTRIDLNGTAYNSNDGAITFTGAVDLAGAGTVTINSDADAAGADGAISITGAVSDTGTDSALTVTANTDTVALANVAVNGAIAVTGSTITLNGTAYNSNDGAITFTGAVNLGANVTINSDADADATDGNVTFTGAVSSDATPRNFTVTAGTGTGTFANLGDPSALVDLSVNAGSIVLNGTISATGNVSLTSTTADTDLTIANSITRNNTTTGTLTFSTTRSIFVTSGADITGTGVGGVTNIVLNSDRDATSGGAISLASGTVITSNGGDITLGGGATPATVPAIGTAANLHGVEMNNAALNAGGGSISVIGTGGNTSTGQRGLEIYGGSTIQASGTGTIALTGTGGAAGSVNFGVRLDGATTLVTSSGSGAITVMGTGGAVATGINMGIDLSAGAKITSTGTSAITVTGTGGAGTTSQGNGVRLIGANSNIESVSGAITITGTAAGSGADAEGVSFFDSGGAAGNVISTGSATISITGTGVGANPGILTRNSGGTGRTIGGGSATGDILLRSLSGTGMTLQAAAIQTTGNVTLNAVGGGTVTQTAGAITAGGLRLLSDAETTFTLTSSTNDITNLAAGVVGSISYTEDATALTVNTAGLSTDTDGNGTLDGTTVGITTTGTGALTLTNGGTLDIAANITTTGAVTQNGAGAVTISGSRTISTTSDAVDFLQAVTLNGSGSTVAINTTAAGTGGNITFQSTLDGTTAGMENLTLIAGTGAVTLGGDVGFTTALGAVSISAAGGINLNAANLITEDGQVDFTGPVTLGTTVTIDTTNFGVGATGANINFNTAATTVDGNAGGEGLTLVADTGAVTFDGDVGFNTALGAVNVTAGGINLNAANLITEDGQVDFTGPVTLGTTVTIDTTNFGVGSGANINFNGGASTVDATTAGVEGLTLTADTGAVTFDGDVGAGTALGAVSIDATAGINLNAANLITEDGQVDMLGPVTLGTSVAIDTTNLGAGTGATIDFIATTVDATAAGVEALTLTAGTGAVIFGGDVGSGTRLGALSIVSADDVTANANITAASFNQTDGTGTTDLNGAVDTDTAAGVTITNETITVDNTITTTGTGVVTLNADTMTLTFTAPGDIISDGAVSLTAAGGITTAGDVTTTDDDVTYVSATTLSGPVSISTGAGGAGNINFSSTLNGTQNLTLLAGTGNITFTGIVGTTPLDDVIITSATNVTTTTFSAATLTQSAGSGTTTLNGAVATTAAGGVSLTGTNLALNNTLTTTGGGTVTVNESGTATLAAAGDIISDGAVSLTATGGITTAGDVITTDDDVTYVSATTLSGPVSINTGAVGAGNINFSSTITGTQDLTLLAGTGNVTVTGDVGATRLGVLTITSGGVVAFSGAGTQQAASLTVTASTSTTFTGNVNLTNGVSLAAGAGNVSFLNGLTAGAASTFANTGSLQLGDASTDVTSLTGALTHTAGVTSLGGTITAPTGATFAVATINSDNILNTTDSAVAFTSTIDSDALETNDLTVNTGTAATTISGVIGGAVNGELGTLTINNTSVAGMALPTTTAGAVNVITNGPVTDFGNLAITGLLSINAGTNAVTLGDGGAETTNFGSLSIVGGTVAITEDSATVFTGTSTISGTLSLTSAGSITDTAGTTLNVTGSTTLDAGANAITLGENPADTTNFGPVLTFTGGAVSLTEDSTMNVTGTATVSLALNAVGVNLAGINAPSMTVNSTGAFSGAVGISDSGASIVPGVSDFNANGFDIELDAPGNNFGTVTLNGGTITLTNVSIVNLAGVTASGAFNLTSLGTLTISSPISSGTAVSLGSTGGDLIIDAAISTSSGNMTLTAAQNVTASAPGTLATAGGAITVTATGGSAQLAGITTNGGNVTVTSGGASSFISPLSISGAFLVNAGGNATFVQALSGGGSLTVNTPGVTTFSSAISGLNSLLTDLPGSTVLAGGALGVSGSFRFNDPVTLAAATVITGPTGRFNNTLNGAQSLTVNLTGDAIFNGPVGGIQPLTSITTTDAVGAMRFYGGVVSTSGAQTYSDAVLLGADTTFTASNLTFTNTVNDDPRTLPSPLTDGAIISAASTGESNLTANVSGLTLFNAAVGQTSRLGDVTTDAGAGSTTTVRANFNATKMDFGDAVLIDGSTPITLNASISSTTEGIRFRQGLTGPGDTIVLSAPNATIISNGNVGSSTDRFAAISVHGRNMILGGNVFAEGDISLAIGTSSNDTINDFLQFNSLDETATRNTTIDSANGAITLGSGAVAGSALKTAAPLRASLFKSNPGDLYLLAKKITVQPFERLAVRNGSLVMIADGTAATDGITLSSTAAANFLILSTSAPLVPSGATTGHGINIRSRLPAGAKDTSDQTVQDRGTELVAGAVQLYSTASVGLLPAPNRTNFAPGSSGGFDYSVIKGNIIAGQGPRVIGILSDGGTTSIVFIADLVTSNSNRSVVPFLNYLDLSTAPGFTTLRDQPITPELFGIIPTGDLALRGVVTQGAAPRDVLEQAFTPTVPRTENTVAPPDTNLAAAVREQLQALGIYARALTPEERKARDLWIAKFVAIPSKVRPAESDYQVADARVEDKAVREVIRLANEIGLIGENQSSLDEVARAFAASYDDYLKTSTPEEKTTDTLVTDFRDWLLASKNPDAVKVLSYLKSLRATLNKIELLGLTQQELEGSKAQIYGSVLRARLNVEPEFLRALVEGMPVDTLWVIDKPEVVRPKVQASFSSEATPAGPAIN